MKTHLCKYCEYSVNNPASLRTHLRKYHADKLAYQCKICSEGMSTLRHLFKHLSCTHLYTEEQKELYYDTHMQHDSCQVCGVSITYKGLGFHPYCCNNHYQNARAQADIKSEDKRQCELCKMYFIGAQGLSNHLTREHKLSELDKQQYYDKHFKKPGEGVCKWCNDNTSFYNIENGYREFCYNTECSVKWHNANENRHQLCGDKISASQIANQNKPNQVGYWMKKGCNEEQAKTLVREKQTTNSVENIQKREKCTLAEAKEIRQQITKKWLDSMPRQNFSNISQDLFWEVCKRGNFNLEDCLFASNNNGIRDYTKNREYRQTTQFSTYSLDFYIPKLNKCIEFDGSYWHSNRSIGRGNASYYKYREEQIIEANKGIQIMHIKEDQYNADKEKVIQQCLDFLNT